MSYRHTLEAAMESLHEIEDLMIGFPGNGAIPAVEIDLALQKLRNLYELMLMMKKPQEGVIAAAVEVASDEVASDKVASVEVAVADKAVAEKTPAPSPKPLPLEDKALKEAQILSDQFKGRKTLHDSLHHAFTKEGEILAHAKPVKDLLAAIAINDRFTFIRELFNNDLPAFESAIKNMNEATSFNDAYNFMIQHFDWDMDSEPVQQLLEIIRRKFITGRHE